MKTLDIMECAELLKIERTHALTLAGNGTLPGAKIGRAWVFLEEDLVEYLRTEVRKQMRERQAAAAVEQDLKASAERNPSMVALPTKATKSRQRKPLPDLSLYDVEPTRS
jgi:excisionase family DNA binding protein